MNLFGCNSVQSCEQLLNFALTSKNERLASLDKDIKEGALSFIRSLPTEEDKQKARKLSGLDERTMR